MTFLMKQSFSFCNKYLLDFKNTRILTECNKRFKGHSKWQNIRHTKADKDREKSLLFSQIVRQMKLAVLGNKNYKYTIQQN